MDFLSPLDCLGKHIGLLAAMQRQIAWCSYSSVSPKYFSRGHSFGRDYAL